ncbi:MAG: hypothetical protein ISQ19_03540 [PS1 clade bacterium]|uniref:Uncharacterized protein n=1 Tax=PS1 clade bacterium TaxID=2175152 RepID=A0A937HHU6_9PROT|nr:hypothetical protein [PS1 clade bacterium]
MSVAVESRQAYGLYNIGYGVLSLVIIIIAYLVRHQPMWFRSISAAIAVFFIFNTFTLLTASQGAFLGFASTLSTMAAEGNAPMMKAFMESNGLTAGQAMTPPTWQVLGPIAMLAHAALSVYLFVAAKWDGETA